MASGTSTAVPVTASPTLLVTNGSTLRRPFIVVPTNGTIYVGGPTVTALAGIPVATNQSLDGDLDPGESIYGIGTGTVDVRVWEGPGA